MKQVLIAEIQENLNQEVFLKGWVFNFRSSGKIYFLQLRDGSGRLQAVVSEKDVSKETWQACQKLTMESSVEVIGKVYEEKRSAYSYEMRVKELKIIQLAEEYPIAKKEHGTDFLLDYRHLWIRSERQVAILKIRDEVIWRMREFFHQKGFVMTDTPILTPTSCEGTTTLFSTKYFDDKAYLAQSGQLYLEALAMALGKVYDFGPTFRSEKSKTRRHLTEFWMLDAEVAFSDFEDIIKLQEELISYLVNQLISHRQKELAILGRNISKLEKVKSPFLRMTYSEAVQKLKKLGSDIKEGEDLGGDDETLLTKDLGKPIFITHYPVKAKAFYMQPDSENPELALCDDLLAPEGYGEIIGGSQRIHDLKLLKKRLKEFKLPKKDYEWYLDLRRYGSVPHAGFGIGLERTIAWLCGLDHVRETIPFPRLLNRLRP